MTFNSYTTQHTRIKLKWVMDININTKAIKLLKENIQENVCTNSFHKDDFKSIFCEQNPENFAIHQS